MEQLASRVFGEGEIFILIVTKIRRSWMKNLHIPSRNILWTSEEGNEVISLQLNTLCSRNRHPVIDTSSVRNIWWLLMIEEWGRVIKIRKGRRGQIVENKYASPQSFMAIDNICVKLRVFAARVYVRYDEVRWCRSDFCGKEWASWEVKPTEWSFC